MIEPSKATPEGWLFLWGAGAYRVNCFSLPQTRLMQRSRGLLLMILALAPYVVLAFFVYDIFHARWMDQFLVGTAHGHVGYDFYSVPRSFINLQHGQNLYNLHYAEWYGPDATPFYYHPVITIAVGSWLSLMPASVAFPVFVCLSAATLLLLGYYWSRYFIDPLHRRIVPILTACSFPVYLMLWNAQMHVFTVVAVVLVLTAVIDMSRNKRADGKLLAGLLFSLFSKPLLLLWIPVLLVLPETRRATFRALIVYVLVSLLFFVLPFLQPTGGNKTHWENIVNQTGRVEQDKEYFSFATTFPLPLPGKLKNSLYLLVPLFLVISSLKLRFAPPQARMRITMYVLLALLASYYFAYSMVWEYHYTTLLAAVPAILFLYVTAEGWERRRLQYCFAAIVFLYLPSTYFLNHQLTTSSAFVMHLTRVLPATVLMILLISVYWQKRKTLFTVAR